jgi:hypothetical protein
MIDWEALDTATKRINPRQAKFITKLTHGWLPTQGHPGYVSEDCPTQSCPCCKAQSETNLHFVTCTENNNNKTQKLLDKISNINPDCGL